MILTVCSCKDDTAERRPSVFRKTADRRSNGGFLYLRLNDKQMRDRFFEALFTPRGELFPTDNLQLYNFNAGTNKYPKILFSVDRMESDLKKWKGIKVPVDCLLFSPAPNTALFAGNATVEITKADNHTVEGSFIGELRHPQNGRTFSLSGEFKAMVKTNR